MTSPNPASSNGPSPYWARYLAAGGGWAGRAKSGPPGEELADLRAGLGRAAGTVPSMWPYYISPTDGRPSRRLEAEHGALALYGLHQQSQRVPMHAAGITTGIALGRLRDKDRFSAEALDRRVAAAVNTTTLPALLQRLRGLVTQLRTESVPMDYTALMRDLELWISPDTRQWVRRRWGLAYHAWQASDRTRGNRS